MSPANLVDGPFTVSGVARQFGVQGWQVRRLFERGLLPPAARAGGYRLIAGGELPAVEAALRRAGYLDDESEAVAFATGEEGR